MIGVLLPYVRKFQRSAESNDIVDRFSYQYTSTILGFSAIMMAASQYVGRPIQCWVPAQFTRTWEKYAETYCFIKGTYFLPGAFASEAELSVTSPDDTVTASPQVGYYQWIPIVLFVQAFLFYLPSIIWRTFNESCELKIKELAAVSEASRKIKSNMSDDQVKGRKFGKYFFKKLVFRNESPVFKETGKVVASGKFLPALYIFVKFLYLANIFFQFWILTYFLDTKSWMWGLQTFQDLIAGREWETTGIFPRVTMCDFSIMDLTTVHDHSIQCVIVINMLAEKVYVFFWFWLLFVGALTAGSLIYWSFIYMLQSVGRSFIYSYLNETPVFHEEQAKRSLLPANFVDNCLTADGVFITRLVQQNSGDLFTTIMLQEMFALYRDHEAEKAYKKNDDLPSAPTEIKDEDDDDIPLPPPTKATVETLSSDDEGEDTDVDSPDTTATLPR
uniref:Innexin n=1 Tax=Caenorhabditis tropicalis TaxID=1561998 RepID=A0A1I7TRH4_9PELO